MAHTSLAQILPLAHPRRTVFRPFDSREPQETTGDVGRDVFNEKPSREEQLASTAMTEKQLSDYVIIHTSLGDIHIKLFPQQVRVVT